MRRSAASCLLLAFLVQLISGDDISVSVSKALEDVLDNYDIRLRPNFAEHPLALGMQLTIVSFDSISEVNMDYTVTMHLHQYWTDERLAFNLSQLQRRSVDILNLSSDFAARIWLPDTFLANDKSSYLHDVTQMNKMIRLHANGSIVYGMRFTTTLACMMDLHHYPLDTQNCTIEIESYGYTVRDVLMHWAEDAVLGMDGLTLPQFTILKYETKDRSEALSTGVYQRLSLSILMQRNTGYFMFQTYLPSILIVMLSWVSFWINHQATSARVTLGITTVLTMTTISSGIRSSLPRISYVKAIDIYLVVCFVYVFAALLEYAAVNYTYWSVRPAKNTANVCQHCPHLLEAKKPTHKNNLREEDIRMSPILSLRRSGSTMQSHRYPSGLRLVAVDHSNMQSAIWTCGANFENEKVPPPATSITNDLTSHSNAKVIRNVNVIDRMSRLVFPVTFTLFNMAYFSFYVI